MANNNEIIKEYALKASLAGLEQTHELAKSIAETNRALTRLGKVFDSSTISQIL